MLNPRSQKDPSLLDGEPPYTNQVVAASGDILVVDDNLANLLAIQAALGDSTGRIVQAQSGTEALAKLLERDFAVVLLDVKMPSMDGLETARMIRNRRRSRHTPIIFVTAHSRDDAEVLEGYKLGAVDFLLKPLVPEVLRAKVSVFVELQRRTAEVAQQAALLREHERLEHARKLESERQKWEAESLRRQMHELEDADQRKDEFLALLGHELRNPLAPIVTGIELLRTWLGRGAPPDAGNMARVCETMERQTRHVTRLVDDLLDVSRITSGKVELRRSLVSIHEVIEEALRTSQPQIERRGHRVIVDIPNEPLFVRGDDVRLVQTVANLLNNAARYTESGGSIRVECRRVDADVEISVADTGRGIAPEFLPHVFERFTQEGNSAGGGLGLGLTLAAELVALHEGTISAFSEGRGKGSRFVVRLPTVTGGDSSPPGAEMPVRPTREGRELVIVVVDDLPDVRELMQELLAEWGHTVHTAENGRSAIETIVNLRPDAAFVDIGLPDMDGYDIATRVRSTFGDESPFLVAMTGFGRDSDRRKAKEAGFDAHMVKPINIDSLKQILSTEVTVNASGRRAHEGNERQP